MVRFAGLALFAAVGGAVLCASPACGATRAWWAHVPLDSLRPVLPPIVTELPAAPVPGDSLAPQPALRALEIGPQPHAPLRLSAHVAWRRAGGEAVPRDGRAPGPLAPDRVRAGHVVWQKTWGPTPVLYSCGEPEWEETRGDSTVFDSVVFWRHAAEGPRPAVAAWRQVARLALADGDTLAADSLLALPALRRSVWAWSALRQRAELAVARGDAAGADSLAEAADRDGWPDAERAAWLALRVRLRSALRDTARAIDLARQAVRAYPSVPATRQALADLEALLRARGDSLGVVDQRASAEVEALAGRGAAAIRRLRRVVADPAAGGEVWRARVRLCQLLRAARRFDEVCATVDSQARGVDWAPQRALLSRERARAELGAGRPDSALAIYSRLAGLEPPLSPAVGWEAGRVAEDAGRWEEALGWYAQVPPGDENGRRARFRSGLLRYARGQLDSALACWAGDPSDEARFWTGVARRALGDTAGGDSLLRRVALRPGYSFYRAAARDTLGARGWPGGIANAFPVQGPAVAALDDVRELTGLGLTADAAQLLARWIAGDGRVRPREPAPLAAEWLWAAELAYQLGRVGLGISLAEQAREQDASLDPRQQWDAVPWAFPPAFESLFVAPRDTVAAALEPALLFAVAYQESRFDPRARSRSDALGLMQLKLGTARDVARWAREPVPTEAALLDPETSVRYGARYLSRLLRRFDGSVAAALSAYNAGPGSLSSRWCELRERGGEALLCELVSNPLAQDYSKRILGYRQGYRELRPTASEP